MTRDEALKKIKKCLALGRSADEHEAAAAMRQAQKLMQEFNVREQEISLLDVHEAEARAAGMAANAWEVRLVRVIAEAFGCDFFTRVEHDLNGAGSYVRKRLWVFVGIDAAPAIAGYACEVLVRQCARQRLEHIAKQPRNCKQATKSARGDLFAKGWALAVAEKVAPMSRPVAETTLVLAYKEQKYGDMGTAKPRDSTHGRKLDSGHLLAGFKAGQSAQLHPGVVGQKPVALLTA